MKWTHINNKDDLEEFYKSIMPLIRETAKGLGYAIGVHGSMRRDLDLIAVPWTEEFKDKDTLARAIQRVSCGLESGKYTWEKKPNQRIATAFPVCWTWHEEPMILSNGHIDLSVVENPELQALKHENATLKALLSHAVACPCSRCEAPNPAPGKAGA